MKLLGVSDWLGLRIEFAAGMCKQCAARLRAGGDRSTGHPHDVRASEAVVVALATVTTLVLVARPLYHASRPSRDASPSAETAAVRPRTLALARTAPLEPTISEHRPRPTPTTAFGPVTPTRHAPARQDRAQAP